MKQIELSPTVNEFLSKSPIPAYINGQWKNTAISTPVIDPANGESIAEVCYANPQTVDDAAQAAHTAFPEWAALSSSERSNALDKLADLIYQNLETLAQLESIDVGKPIENARGFDIPFGAECFKYYAQIGRNAVYNIPLELSDIDAHIHRAPYGVCGFIFPWNFPFTLLCWGIAPALAAGNTVVIKASEVTPLSSLFLATLFEEAGIPAGVINIFTGSGVDSGQPLAEHHLIKRMSFTGSPEVGKLIGKICGERLVPCKLELGGKGAALITQDADIGLAAESLAGAITLNTGQVCCTATRWYVHETIYDDFVSQVTNYLTDTTVGSPRSTTTQMGPLVSKAQFDRVKSYYEKGISEGATALLKLQLPEIESGTHGFFVKPHLLGGSDENICCREEIFGPTAFVIKYKDESDAVKRINKLAYGLANSIWSKDIDRAAKLAEKLISGNSWINAHNVFAYGLPYGGVNLRGLGGGVNSPDTFDDYLRNQTIARPL